MCIRDSPYTAVRGLLTGILNRNSRVENMDIMETVDTKTSDDFLYITYTNIDAVSYTHLDVYKRQTVYSPRS